MTASLATVLAHQGGWDEILLVLTPIALFAGLLWLANSRADKQVRQRQSPDEPTDGDDGAATGDDTDTDDATGTGARQDPT